jgi:hypothetical protein
VFNRFAIYRETAPTYVTTTRFTKEFIFKVYSAHANSSEEITLGIIKQGAPQYITLSIL